jgi:hypothetical protein
VVAEGLTQNLSIENNVDYKRVVVLVGPIAAGMAGRDIRHGVVA